MTETIEARLVELGIRLPEAAAPVANYLPYLINDNTVYVSGQLPIKDGKLQYVGKIGSDVSIENGALAAGLCAMNIIAQVKKACDGNLERVIRVIKLNGFVNSHGDFTNHPAVINGASDLMVNVFGDIGKHTRCAVGMSSLPLDAAVEIDAIIKIS